MALHTKVLSTVCLQIVVHIQLCCRPRIILLDVVSASANVDTFKTRDKKSTNLTNALLLLLQAKHEHHIGVVSDVSPRLMPYEAASHQSSLLGANILDSQYEHKA